MPTNVKLIPEGFSQAKSRGVMFWFDQHRDPHFRTPDGVPIFEQGRPTGVGWSVPPMAWQPRNP